MQSYENTPISPIKRLGVSLNVDTGYNKGKGREMSPPGTPQENYRLGKSNSMVGNQVLKARNGIRETFLDDITPTNPPSNRDNEQDMGRTNRDSHDLSLSPRQVTRDSLVDHMLLSLDQFSFGQEEFGRQPTVEEEQLYASLGDEPYQPTSNFASRNGRGAGQHSFSYSSDYDNADDSSRYSSQQSRGRRSNSSSNFQATTGRVEGKRNGTGANSSFGSSTFGGSRGLPQNIPPRGTHSHSGKGSKGSSSVNSLDLGYAQVTGSQRWARGLVGRSSSFDYGSDHQMSNTQSAPMLHTNNSTVFNPYDYDAAPTPTVPVGPRRIRPPSPIMIAEPSPIEPAPHRVERKRSTRSSKSGYKGKLSGNSSGRFDYGHGPNLPPMPAFIKGTAPAPSVGYGKAKEAPLPSPSLFHAPKDRPGFFRRVFGSRNNAAHAPEPPPPSHGSTTSAETPDRPSSKAHHIGNQLRSQHAASSREPPPTPKEHSHVLSKKSSSFFRRRKKSVSEAGTTVPLPVVPPLHLQAENGPEKVPASPVSSLRLVMNPYLRTPARSPIDLYPREEDIDRQMNSSPELHRTVRGFSPDYEPDKSATIRTVRSNERDRAEPDQSSQQAYQDNLGADANRSDNAREEVETFLQDSSDTDRDTTLTNTEPTPAAALEPASYNNESGAASSSVARDIALVAEYERVYSKQFPMPPKLDPSLLSPAVADALRSPTEPKSNLKNTVVSMPAKDEAWVMLTPTRAEEKDNRIWLEPSSSEEDILGPTNLTLLPKPEESSNRTSSSTDTVYKSATSLPIVQVDGEEPSVSPPRKLMTAAEALKSLDPEVAAAPEIDIPNESDRERAQKIYDGNEDFIQKERAATWLGEEGETRARTLVAYMGLYNFTNLNILAALRLMCGRLLLKAESQQVDRILVAFSRRWCKCNPDHGFKGNDIVHTICYSILLLNTDLHLADIEQKMTRSQFVKNTMPTIRKCVADSVPDAFDARPTVLPGKGSAFSSDPSKDNLKAERSSIEVERPSWRTSFKPLPRTDQDGNIPTPLNYDTPSDDCGPLVKAPFHGTMRTWEVQVEIVLKDFYNSIRNERLPLFGAPVEKPHLQAPSTNTLSVFANGMLRRSPSVLSKAPSEAHSYARGRTAETVRVGNGKWANKNRSRPRLYPGSTMGSSRTSLDDQSSMWSPSVSSSTWSKYSLGKTQTSMSVDSFASSMPQGDYQQSIGFANALSQAIIREETIGSIRSGGSDRDELRVTPLLEDESLELAGAPWAKEGIVKHKHHLEALDKKAKDRNWNEVFAVIEKGYMSLFSFSTKSTRNKSKARTAGGVVGGGNWQDNAESLGSFLLRQTIASALPSPGYSKARPHVWALSLPTGAVHLFQVGTPEIVKEFVSTANYWSARLSNHPLVGGISNIEYGWSDAIVNNALVTAINESTSRSSISGARTSIQSSLRSSSDHGISSGGSIRARLPGDKVNISDWTPPTQSMRASNLMEQDQLRTLTDYVAGIEEDLQKHNQLRSSMLLAFTPRHPNATKAMANWEKKSSYLLREIIKFRTYIDCLNAAEISKQNIYAQREAQIALEEEDDDEGNTTLKAG